MKKKVRSTGEDCREYHQRRNCRPASPSYCFGTQLWAGLQRGDASQPLRHTNLGLFQTGWKLDRADKAVPAFRDRFYKVGPFGIVGESAANLVNRKIDSVLEIDERGIGPEVPLDFLSGHDLSGSFNEEQQDPEGLRLELE
jgi:hypothetical protein